MNKSKIYMTDKHLSGRFAREKLELTGTSDGQDCHSDVTMNQVPIEVFKSEKLDDSLNKRALVSQLDEL